jgi:hypothetical protein
METDGQQEQMQSAEERSEKTEGQPYEETDFFHSEPLPVLCCFRRIVR